MEQPPNEVPGSYPQPGQGFPPPPPPGYQPPPPPPPGYQPPPPPPPGYQPPQGFPQQPQPQGFPPQPQGYPQQPQGYQPPGYQQPADQPGFQPPPPQKSKKKGCLIAVAVAMILGLAGCGGLFFLGAKAIGGSEKAGKSFIVDVLAGRTDSAYERTSAEFKSTISKDELATSTASLAQNFNGATIKRQNVNVSNNNGVSAAQVNYLLSKGGATTTVLVDLVSEGGKWKVLNFSSTA